MIHPLQQRGLTLIELMLTLSLGALLLSLSWPMMSRFLANQHIITASNSLVAHLQFARHTAVTRNEHIIACPSPDQQTCDGNRWDLGWIIFADPDRNGRMDQMDRLLRVVSASERVRVESGGRYRVRFQPNGGAYGSNLSLRVCPIRSDVAGRAVIVSNPGRVRVQRRLSSEECAA